MIYHPLGNTGLQVSVLSYGASPLGSVFRPVDEAESMRLAHPASSAVLQWTGRDEKG